MQFKHNLSLSKKIRARKRHPCLRLLRKLLLHKDHSEVAEDILNLK